MLIKNLVLLRSGQITSILCQISLQKNDETCKRSRASARSGLWEFEKVVFGLCNIFLYDVFISAYITIHKEGSR